MKESEDELEGKEIEKQLEHDERRRIRVWNGRNFVSCVWMEMFLLLLCWKYELEIGCVNNLVNFLIKHAEIGLSWNKFLVNYPSRIKKYFCTQKK